MDAAGLVPLLPVCEQISWVFHTIMFLASLYLAMLISNWGMLEK